MESILGGIWVNQSTANVNGTNAHSTDAVSVEVEVSENGQDLSIFKENRSTARVQ